MCSCAAFERGGRLLCLARVARKRANDEDAVADLHALQQLGSHRFPLEMVTTHTFGLKDAEYAIKSVGNEGAKDVIHVSLLPWA